MLLIGASMLLRSLRTKRFHTGRPPSRAGKGKAFFGSGKTTNAVRKTIVGSCSCGKVGFEGKGESCLNFYTHSSGPREASGQPFLKASGYKPHQVEFTGPVISSLDDATKMPSGSKNAHYFCPCEKSEYLGVDATRWLGMVVLNTDKSVSALEDSQLPNHHLFYADRVADIDDNLPKWKTVIEGERLASDGKPFVAHSGHNETEGSFGYGYSATGSLMKDVLPMSPTLGPEPTEYHFAENDPPLNHWTKISHQKVKERVANKYNPSPGEFLAPKNTTRDVIIVGGGHNGLVSAAYLAKQGLDVLVLERRDVIGGAAITEEIIPGFKFSRASYLAGLLRPKVIKELELERHGLKYLQRNPSSFTPSLVNGPLKGKSLILGSDMEANRASIAQFSQRDAISYSKYEEYLSGVRELVQPLLDNAPPDLTQGKWREKLRTASTLLEMARVAVKHRKSIIPFYELLTAPASHILNRWFESEILKTTLACDAVIGALVGPKQAGSAYVLLHHVMGEAAGQKGVWAYVEGGMGSVSHSIWSAASEAGAELCLNATVDRFLFNDNYDDIKKGVKGVVMADGTEITSKIVISNTTPYHTFLELMPGLSRDSGDKSHKLTAPDEWNHHLRHTDYECGAFKINCAVDSLPNFACMPNELPGADGFVSAGPQHCGTIHFENTMQELEDAYREASSGIPATRPVIEMTIPTSVDTTLAPKGKHVVQLFVQFAPYTIDPKVGHWADEEFKNKFADRVFAIVDESA